ncbi:cell division protein FtsA [Jeotgalicoccus coquinae]|uniref:Cell division protein FtsA n=1 Tax=Jeotgalicoccus coquinae TaxID=709509 RepID=A0A6V7RKZ4_9STAP|nr:cell division protein FtsA [Jeotgalicoccus coquinae]MBB6422536.1 cell division protein FtsA [Jeotgalicoccus coquinae]GGE15126.1 cell division protein FtsA [Jeotgalicoccus coquinae]CAD2078194.1 Cell division protein FtsA [Jeotgalicoccus coquinae]
MKEHYYVALDIGSSSVKVVVGEKFHNGVNVIGTGQTFTDGVSKGMINDFDQAKNAITDTIKKAKIASGVDIDEVFVKIPIADTHIHFTEDAIRFGGEATEITGEHIEELLENVRMNDSAGQYETVSVYPVSFVVDSLHEVNDPKDMIAEESLAVKAGVVSANRTLLINIVKCVEAAGLTILDVYSDAVNYQHVLTDAEIELGAVVIDMGLDLTQFAYYERGSLKYANSVGIAGRDITLDLVDEFNTSYDEADQAKEQYGHAFFDLASDEEKMMLAQNDSGQPAEVTSKDLADVIELVVEDAFMAVFEDLAKNGINNVQGGFVLTGGSANIRGIKELMQDLVAEKVRVHIPNQMGARKPEFTSAISVLSSGIMFDELLEYVTIDNYDDYPETDSQNAVNDDQEAQPANFFTGLFAKRKEENELQVNRDEDSYEDDYNYPDEDSVEESQADEDAADDEYEDYADDDAEIRSERPEQEPKEQGDLGTKFKKIFKNLFE